MIKFPWYLVICFILGLFAGAMPSSVLADGRDRLLLIVREACVASRSPLDRGDPCDPENQHRTNSMELVLRGQLGPRFDRMAVWALPVDDVAALARAEETFQRVRARYSVDLWVLPESQSGRVEAVIGEWVAVAVNPPRRLVWASGARHGELAGRTVEVPAESKVARAGWIEFVTAMKDDASFADREMQRLWDRARKEVQAQLPASRFSGRLIPWVSPGVDPQGGELSEAALQEGWRFYEAAFPHPLEGIPGEVDELGAQAWIDGDGLKLLTSQIEKWLGPVGKRLLSSVMGVRLVSREDGFRVSIHSRSRQSVVWDQPESLFGRKGLWTGFTLPEVLKARFRLSKGMLRIDAAQEERPFLVNLSLQGFPLGVEFRGAGLDLDTGEYQVEAGLFGGALRLVGRGRLFSKQWDGIDFWESVRRSLGDWTSTPAFFVESASVGSGG